MLFSEMNWKETACWGKKPFRHEIRHLRRRKTSRFTSYTPILLRLLKTMNCVCVFARGLGAIRLHILFALVCQSVYWCCLFSAIKIQEIKINYINESINLLFVSCSVRISTESMWLLNKCMMTVLCFDFVKYLLYHCIFDACVLCVHFTLIVSWQLWLCRRSFMSFFCVCI